MPFPSETFVGQLSDWYAQKELRQYYALVTGFLAQEHRDDGSHGSITAEALTVSDGVVERGRSVAMGVWTDVAYAAGNFTASGAMTWTVGSGDQKTYAYTLVGDTMTLCFKVDGTTVGGTPSTDLRIALPGGVTAARTTTGAFQYLDAGGAATPGYWQVDVGTAYLRLLKQAFANWSSATDTTSVAGTVVISLA